ncbi:MAG TPA: M3 family metallopeptidase, partial [Steroidobacteraceae bacterium]|nr:M3 family metallopeptidase [Steroidobacteraceae bacterium]
MTTLAAAAGTEAARNSVMADNPFFSPSPLSFELPPFDRIHDSDYVPAFETGMRDELKEVAAIARNPRPPTFENTIVALERSGRLLRRVEHVFSNLNACNTDPEMQRIDTEMAPRITAHEDAILLDPALWARIDALYRQRASLHLDPESLELLTRYHTRFVRAGARLAAPDKKRLRSINEQLSSLTTRFRQNVLKATADAAVVVDDVGELDGLTPVQIGALAQAAATRGLKGKWLITLQNTTQQPLLASLRNRSLRERLFRASVHRGLSAPTDNTVVIAQIVKLRAERAVLLGYPDHAAYVLEDESAGSPAAVLDMIRQVAPAAVARAHQEAGEIQKLIDAQSAAHGVPSFRLEPWDWSFYAEQVRKA